MSDGKGRAHAVQRRRRNEEQPATGNGAGPASSAWDAAGSEMEPTSWRIMESPIFETLVSMQSLLVDWYDEPWAEEARERLGVAFLRDLRRTFEPFRLGTDLLELAVPEAVDQEVDAFVRHVRGMKFVEFSHFVFGRLVPIKGGELSIEPEEIKNILDNYGDYAHYIESLGRADWAANGPGYQKNFTDLVERFWNNFFKDRISSLSVQHNVSIARNEGYGREYGSQALYRLLTGRTKGCCPLIPDSVLREVTFIPVVNFTQPALVYTGEHDVTVVYHASRTPDRLAELARREQQLIAIARALGDPTRFQIVKLLFQNRKALNGQNIAERVRVSKSVVSKHLAQLKDAGIVLESSPDRRNNIYSIDLTNIRSLSPSLLEVLRG